MESFKSFSKQNLLIISSSEKKQDEFKTYVLTSKDFSQAEKAMIQAETFEVAQKDAISAQERFTRSHQKGCGLWSKRYQDTATIVQGVINDFSPLIDLIKTCAAPYGCMAVGTVSLFFQVASRKNEMEEKMASVLAAIFNRLPGFNLYQKIYIENHELDVLLQSKISSAYEEFIDFSIFATKYYKTSGLKRWLRAFGTLNTLQTKAESVRDITTDIRHLCDELLDKNVHHIKTSNISITMSNQRLEERLKNVEATASSTSKELDDLRVDETQALLNLASFSEEAQLKALEAYRYGLDNDQEINMRFLQQMRGEELELFKGCQDYQRWIGSPSASLLVLSAYNHSIIDYGNKFCWMSPLAMDLIEGLRQTDSASASASNIYAYCVIPYSGLHLYHDVLPSLLLQLLRKKPQALKDRKKYNELRAQLSMFQSPPAGTDDPDEFKADTMKKIALQIISLFDESDTVYIIVDRADRCDRVRPKKFDHRKALIRVLVAMVQTARAKLRILAVVSGYGWQVQEYADEFGITMKDRVIIHRAEQGGGSFE